VLPVLNKKAVEGLVKAAISLGCRVNRRSVFARKQYFYPDLPKAYQISQFDLPLAEHGKMDIEADKGPKTVRIQRIHLEEDAGKLLHAVGSRALDYSLVDLNRSSVPLMEIVSEPDIRTPDEAADYLQRLRGVLRAAGVSDCDMEKGSMRCDANVSVRPVGQEKLGTRAEVKNMNSFKSVRDAVAHEIARQVALVEGGGRVVQETRLWDQDLAETRSMRSKEQAHDYRYFPDPDLVPVELSDAQIEAWRKDIPEMPEVRKKKYETAFKLDAYPAGLLSSEAAYGTYFEKAVSASQSPAPEVASVVANLMTNDLFGRLNEAGKTIEDSPVPPEHTGALARLVLKGTINSKAAKMVFDEMFSGGGSPDEIVKAKGLVQVDDEGQIKGWVQEVIAANAKIVADVKSGKEAAIGSLVGQVMKKSSGRANPQTVNKLLRQALLS
jgi:aspartyl-tRNA(Asn)/glutamyl-tRNA(Gln) amidotransferase subunit B